MDTHDINVIESGLYNYYNYDLTTRRSVYTSCKISPQTVKIVGIVALIFALCLVIGLFTLLAVVFHYLVVI